MKKNQCLRRQAWIEPVPIVYRYPARDALAEAAAAKIRLGECVTSEDSPEFASPERDAPLPSTHEQLRGESERRAQAWQADWDVLAYDPSRKPRSRIH